jgi:hypothetical protein
MCTYPAQRIQARINIDMYKLRNLYADKTGAQKIRGDAIPSPTIHQ